MKRLVVQAARDHRRGVARARHRPAGRDLARVSLNPLLSAVVELRPTTDGDLPCAPRDLRRRDRHGVRAPRLRRPVTLVRRLLDPPTARPDDRRRLRRGRRRWCGRVRVGVDARRRLVPRLSVHPGPCARPGVGPQLLDAVWGDAPRRRTVTDAIQPVSNVLYARRGLAPVTPLLTFTGTPQIDAAAGEAPVDLGALDAVAYGFDRTVDHRYWELHARRTEWGDAYSYMFPGGDVGPVAGATPQAASRALGDRARERLIGRCASGFPAPRASSSTSRCARAFASTPCPGSCCSRPASSRRRRSHPPGYMLF